MNTKSISIKLTAAALMLFTTPARADSTPFQNKMQEMEGYYAQLKATAAKKRLTPTAKVQIDTTLAAMGNLAKDLESPSLSRGKVFNANAEKFRAEVAKLRRRLVNADLAEMRNIVSETALSCGNCHSCRAQD